MRVWISRVFVLCVVVVCLLLSGGIGCQGPCTTLTKTYALSGCLGEGECKTSQTDCQVRFECGSSFQFCQGLMVGREINMRCAATDGHNFQAIVGIQETSLRLTIVKADSVCQAELKPK